MKTAPAAPPDAEARPRSRLTFGDVQALPLRRETPSEIRFAHRWAVGLLVAALAGGILYVLRSAAPAAPWWVGAVVLALAAAGALAAAWRFEVDLGLATRRYRIRRGLWFRTSTVEGSLDDLALLLKKRWARSSAGRQRGEHLVWTVEIEPAGETRPICLFASLREDEARRRWKELAQKLEVAATDASADVRERMTRGGPDRRRAEDRKDAAAYEPPPAWSGIQVTDGPTGKVVLLPATGFHPVLLLTLLFGLAFAGFAMLALAAATGLVPMKVSGSRTLVAMMALVFSAVGLAIAALPILGAAARQRIEGTGEALVYSVVIFGKPFGLRRLRKDRIETIDVRANTSSRRAGGQEVAIRHDEGVVVLGRQLDPEVLRWLRDALVFLALR